MSRNRSKDILSAIGHLVTLSSLIQYLYAPKTSETWIKVWVLADSKNGYFSTKLQVCTGNADSREKALGAKDGKELTAHLHWKKHHVFFNNYFTTVCIYACGTDNMEGQERFP